jgi:hypothetical protein
LWPTCFSLFDNLTVINLFHYMIWIWQRMHYLGILFVWMLMILYGYVIEHCYHGGWIVIGRSKEGLIDLEIFTTWWYASTRCTVVGLLSGPLHPMFSFGRVCIGDGDMWHLLWSFKEGNHSPDLGSTPLAGCIDAK